MDSLSDHETKFATITQVSSKLGVWTVTPGTGIIALGAIRVRALASSVMSLTTSPRSKSRSPTTAASNQPSRHQSASENPMNRTQCDSESLGAIAVFKPLGSSKTHCEMITAIPRQLTIRVLFPSSECS